MWKKIGLFALFFQVVCFANSSNELPLCLKNIEKKTQKKFKNYDVRISYAGDRKCQRLEIFKNDKSVFYESGLDHHYSLKSNGLHKNNLLFVANWSGGAHCCTTLLVFELGEQFVKKDEVYAGNFDPKIIDLDRDGVPEIVITDDFLAYQFSSFAASAKGIVVLKYSNGKYLLAEDLMRRRLKSNFDESKRPPHGWKNDFLEHGSDWPPEAFIQTLTDIIYTGNGDRALNFVDQTWPNDVAGKDEFLRSYKSALSGSHYYSKAVKYLVASK